MYDLEIFLALIDLPLHVTPEQCLAADDPATEVTQGITVPFADFHSRQLEGMLSHLSEVVCANYQDGFSNG